MGVVHVVTIAASSCEQVPRGLKTSVPNVHAATLAPAIFPPPLSKCFLSHGWVRFDLGSLPRETHSAGDNRTLLMAHRSQFIRD